MSELSGKEADKFARRMLKRETKRIWKRQAMRVSVNRLREIARDLESQTRQFNLELGEKEIIDFDKEWMVAIINESGLSDEWRFE